MSEHTRPKTIFIFGRAGSGKGTQAKKIIEHLGKNQTLYFYAGQKFRELTDSVDTYTIRLLKEKILNTGELAPRFFAIWAWADTLIENLRPEQHLVLDGSPRSRLETEALEQILDFYERDDATLLYIDVPEEEVAKRLTLRGRADDTDSGIRGRMEYFDRELPEMEEFLRKTHRIHLRRVDGVGSEEEVFERIRSAIL